MGPEALAQVLQPLAIRTHPNLIVGLQTSDDAAIFRVSAEQAIVQTIDFFTPIVDDPYTYGAIAAANSMSDVYAMGGDVQFALNVVAFPDNLDPSILSAILRGGSDKVAEAGGVIAGGHTVTDDEPKYGLAVTGFVHPERVWRKAGARPGDRLYLTKPLGTGIVATALKNQVAVSEHIAAAVRSMELLNKAASEAARTFSVSACTDITGFGLLGHAWEVADRSEVRLRFEADSIPILPGVLEYARAGQIPGGLNRNRSYFEAAGVAFAKGVDPEMISLLFDPQTSGGLLFAIPADQVAAFDTAFAERGLSLWAIGCVEAGTGVVVEP
jgi:selenide, water dikinase